MRLSKMTAVCSVAMATLLLAACDVTTPTQVKSAQMQVVDAMKTEEMAAGNPDPTRVNVVADDYLRNGRGIIRVVVPYANGSTAGKVLAARQGNAYKAAFAQRGVKVTDINLTAVPPEDTHAIVVSYMSTQARPPADCAHMTGYDGGGTIQQVEKYRLGCEMKTAMSQMIAHPDDLMGNAGTPDDNSRRQGAVTEHWSSGKTNEPLSGLNASTTGTTTVTGGGVSAGTKNPSNGGGG